MCGSKFPTCKSIAIVLCNNVVKFYVHIRKTHFLMPSRISVLSIPKQHVHVLSILPKQHVILVR